MVAKIPHRRTPRRARRTKNSVRDSNFQVLVYFQLTNFNVELKSLLLGLGVQADPLFGAGVGR